MSSLTTLPFFITTPHPCAYLEPQQAKTLLADPQADMTTALYGQLANLGFRRSGAQIYRPACDQCQACIPVRIPVDQYQHTRRESRIWKRNQDLQVKVLPTEFRNDHYDLYQRYLHARHRGGGMDQPTPEAYLAFLRSDWCVTRFIEFRLAGELLAVAVSDILPQGLSAVYTFFEPQQARRSLGNFTILWQIAESRRRQLPWLYLGYWIQESQKMRYKGQFHPLQALQNGVWSELGPNPREAPVPGKTNTL